MIITEMGEEKLDFSIWNSLITIEENDLFVYNYEYEGEYSAGRLPNYPEFRVFYLERLYQSQARQAGVVSPKSI